MLMLLPTPLPPLLLLLLLLLLMMMMMMTWAELLHKVVMVQQTTRLCTTR